MVRSILLAPAVGLLLLGAAACDTGGGEASETATNRTETATETAPSETTSGAVSTVAAPDGSAPSRVGTKPRERRIATVPLRASARSFRLERLADEFLEPVYVASNRGEPNRVYVVERAGRVVAVEDGRALPEPLLDLTGRVRTEIEEGLHSIAFHPDYPDDPRLYADYNDLNGDLHVREFTVENGRASASAGRDLLVVDKTEGVKWHNGGQLEFGPDGKLYVSVGDSARNPFDNLRPPRPTTADPDNNAQNLELLFGKLLRLDVDTDEPEPEIVAYGLRNPWRFSFDRKTDDLYIADVGQFAREEVDYLPAGGTDRLVNFGWSVYEGGDFYNQDHPVRGNGRLVWPVLQYAHGNGGLYCPERGSITGGYVYRGRAIPALRGRYVFGDYCSGELWTTRIANGRAHDTRKERATVSNLSSFGQDANGELYATSIILSAVYRLTPP